MEQYESCGKQNRVQLPLTLTLGVCDEPSKHVMVDLSQIYVDLQKGIMILKTVLGNNGHILNDITIYIQCSPNDTMLEFVDYETAKERTRDNAELDLYKQQAIERLC